MKRWVAVCLWCEEAITLRWPWSTPRCTDEVACMRRVRENNYGPPDEDRDLDLPPDDIAVCSVCKGSGEVFLRQDWATGALDYDTCTWCEGTGVDHYHRTSFFAGREA